MTTNPNMPAKVSHIVIGVTNLTKSLEFYRGTLGLSVTGQTSELAFVSASSITLLLSQAMGQAIKPGMESMEIVFPVESVLAAHELLKEKGCQFKRPPSEVSPGLWNAIFTDPDGHFLSVLGGK